MKKFRQSETENAAERSYTKRYLQRKIQEKEAEELIDDYLANERNPNRLDGLGRKRGERS